MLRMLCDLRGKNILFLELGRLAGGGFGGCFLRF